MIHFHHSVVFIQLLAIESGKDVVRSVGSYGEGDHLPVEGSVKYPVVCSDACERDQSTSDTPGGETNRQGVASIAFTDVSADFELVEQLYM